MNCTMEPAKDQCAYYFIKERIESLQIKVWLQQLTGSQLVAASPRVVVGGVRSGCGIEQEGGIPLVSLPTSSVPPPDTTLTSHNTQHLIIKWQQKLLSACEAVEYNRPVYADDPDHKSLYQQALKQKRKKKRRNRIFTYTHKDNYHLQNKQNTSTSKRPEPESCIRQRINITRFTSKKNNKENSSPDGPRKLKKETVKNINQDDSPAHQYFYIMADLAPAENLGESRAYEVVLCVLMYDSRGQLTISPDFTKPGHKPYRLESYGSDNALYEYRLENVSPTCSPDERQHEEQLAEQLARQRLEEIQKVVGCEWEGGGGGGGGERREGEVRLVVAGEITRALHFHQADHLYLHYTLYLPPGWRLNNEDEMEGFTPTCAVSYVEGIPTAHYSTPFTFDLIRHSSGRGWPLFLLGAYSVDWLGRDRDEGYASFLLPTPGDKGVDGVYSVGTWRPSHTSPMDKMRRYFLGGCQLITDSSYLALPASSQVDRVSRLGFSTVSSGTIELKINTLVQADTSSTELGVMLETRPGWQLSTLAVIEAFNKSRQKLRAAKQGIKSQI